MSDETVEMKTLRVTLECLEADKSEIQIAITKPTEYGKWPSGEEFALIAKLSLLLNIINAQLEALEDLKEAIEHNLSA